MLAPALSTILKDISNDRPVSSQVNRIFDSNRPSVTTSQRFEFCKALLDLILQNPNGPAALYFTPAISCLRTLAPSLKAGDASTVDLVARVEKYTVKFGLLACDNNDYPVIRNCILHELENSLRLLCDARSSISFPTVPSSKSLRRRAKSYNERSKELLDHKENDDPQARSSSSKNRRASGRLKPVEITNILDHLIFSGSSSLPSNALLPHKDSSLVSRVISGALIIRLTSDLLTATPGDRIYLIKVVALPWLRHLQSFPEPSNYEYIKNFVNRICVYLHKAMSETNCQLTKARALSLNLSIRDPAPEAFAYELHKVALKLISSSKQGLVQQETMDVVVSIYEDGLQYLSSISSDEINWADEELSMWLDHIIHVWCRINSKTLPDIFAKRLKYSSTSKDIQKDLSQCFQVQAELFNLGAYSRKIFQHSDFNKRKSPEKTWTKVEELILSIRTPDLFLVNVRWSPDSAVIDTEDCMDKLSIYLRFLHLIEPLRVMLSNEGKSKLSSVGPVGNIILRRHVSALLASLQLMSSTEFENAGLNETQKKRVIVRVNRLTSGALEASKELISYYWTQQEPEMVCNVVSCVARILDYFSNWYDEFSKKWWEWFLSSLKSFSENNRVAIEKLREPDRERQENSLKMILAHCDDVIPKEYKNTDISNGRMTLLRTLRRIFISQGDWYGSFAVSEKILSIELSEKTADKLESLESLESSYPFLQDLVRATTERSDEGQFLNLIEYSLNETLTAKLILGLIMEYQCYVRSNQSSFRSREGFFETFHGLQRARYFLFHQIPTSQRCRLHQVHQLWVSYVVEGGPQWSKRRGKQLYRSILRDSKSTCNGHVKTSAFGFEGGLTMCSSTQNRYLSSLVDIWKFTEEETFHQLVDVLEELEQLKKDDLFESCGREHLLLAGEILDWASYSLALKDYDLHALRYRMLAEEQREICGIPRGENLFLRDLCLRVASSTLYDWYLTARGQNNLSPELKQVKLKFAAWNYQDALKMIDPVEDELHPYEKALAHEFGSGNITSALLHSHKALKSIVKRLATTTRESSHINNEENQFHIGGAIINMKADIRTESGQGLMRELLELVNTLFQHARLHFEAESINLGQYFMERCYKLATECLPEGNYTLTSVMAAYHAKSQSSKPDQSTISFLKEAVIGFSEKESLMEHGRNVVSEHEMWNQLTVCRYRHDNIISNQDIIRACDISGYAVKSKKTDNDSWAKRAGIEVNILKAIAFSNDGEAEKAIMLMKPLLKRFPILRVNLRVFAHYHMARSLWKVHQSKELPKKIPRRRNTRSKSKPAINSKEKCPDIPKETCDVIEQTLQQVTTDFNVPWICRRVYGLQSLKIQKQSQQNCATDVSLLAKKIGASFNVRWRLIMKSKLDSLITQGVTSEANRLQQLQELFGEMSIGELEKLIQMLREHNYTIIGIDIDDSRENLLLWRICKHGTFLEKKPIPQDGSASIGGILKRINDVVTTKREMPECREKLTNKEKGEWWADRFRLDDELGQIVSEIETEWLGDSGYLMDPDHFRDEDTDKRLQGRSIEEAGQVVLLVDTQLERIPWECVGVLRERVVSVTRAPSLAFLERHLRAPMNPIDQHDMFYLVNPTGEFTKTETRFREVVTKKDRKWDGFCGKCSREEVSSRYNAQRMYMYCGHGTGVAFMSPRRFEKTEDAPVTLLMGCSSAKPDNLGVEDEESNGAAVDFLIRGSPAVVGTLWDVSDGEIDRFTLSLLGLWTGASSQGNDPEFVSLAEAVARSRSACRTPYLVGAACIVMGAPNILVDPGPDEE